MKNQIKNQIFQIEIVPPKQHSNQLETDLQTFSENYQKVIETGNCISIADKPMGHLTIQGKDLIERLGSDVKSEQVIIHLNTYYAKKDLDEILSACQSKGIKYLLIITGDGSEDLPKLQPSDFGREEDVESVTSVEMLQYITDHYPDAFVLGAVFNPYSEKEAEMNKLQRKLDAGASFIVTQPIIAKHPVVDELLESYPEVPVIISAWMGKNIKLLADSIGSDVKIDADFDPIETLKQLQSIYPACGFRLSLLRFGSETEEQLLNNSLNLK